VTGPAQLPVLVVDDTESNRYILSTWLRRAGYDVREAATGAEALRQLADDLALVVLDVHLPDVSGFEVCEAIKTDPRTASVPVLHVSATAIQARDRATGLDNGADAYLVEPLEAGEFLASVGALIRWSEARRRAEGLVERLTTLSAATLTVNSSATLAGLVQAAAEGAVAMTGRETVVAAWFEAHEPHAAHARVGAGTVVAATAGHGTGPVGTGRLPAAEVAALVPGSALHSSGEWLVADVVGRSGPLGVLAVADEGGAASQDDALLLAHYARVLAVALDNLSLFHREHTLALTLQRSLLPARLPQRAGLELAARYSASDQHAEVGGDFYDAFPLPDGGLAVAIGDVQGHSMTAAAVMGELRYSLRAYALDGHGPQAVLERLNQLLLDNEPDLTATACLMYLAPSLDRVLVANAGHPAPLLHAGGTVRPFGGGGTMLGLPGGVAVAVEEVLPEGAAVLLFTDGLVERRERDIDEGIHHVAGLLAARGAGEDLLDHLLLDVGRHEDDVAVLLVTRQG